MRWAIERVNQYRLVEDGVFDYIQLGAPVTGRVVSAHVIQEHLAIRGMFNQAYQEKANLK